MIMFTSLYFAFLRKRFKQAIDTAQQQTQPERAFPNWNDDAWTDALQRLRHLIEFDFPSLLDSTIGLPGARPYDEGVGMIPVRLSELRQMFLEGRVQHSKSYQPFHFDPIRDVVLLTLLAALLDMGAASGVSFSLSVGLAGLTLTENAGAVRTICLVYGTYSPSVVPMVNGYLSDVEAALGTLPTFEVLIIPCAQYKVGTVSAFAPTPISSRSLPGGTVAKRTFVNPYFSSILSISVILSGNCEQYWRSKMNHPRPFLTQIIAFLRSTCGLRDFKIDSQLFAVEFDALLIGADPLTIVAVECKTAVSERNLRHSIRAEKFHMVGAHKQ